MGTSLVVEVRIIQVVMVGIVQVVEVGITQVAMVVITLVAKVDRFEEACLSAIVQAAYC